MFSDVRDATSPRAAALWRWSAITTGKQHRAIGILLQVLSLASTRPERYHHFAVDATTPMVDPVGDVYRQLGIDGQDARARASLFVPGLRGLRQDRSVTGDNHRVDSAAHALVNTATGLPERESGRVMVSAPRAASRSSMRRGP